MSLTTRDATALKSPAAGRVDVWDVGIPGSGLRLYSSGVRSVGLWACLVLILGGANLVLADPITRRQLLRRVDKTVLARKHHIPPEALKDFRLRVLLSIDSVEPPSPRVGDVLTVSYTLTNFTLDSVAGQTEGSFQLQALVNQDGSAPLGVDIAAGESLTGAMKTAPATRDGPSKVGLAFRWKCHQGPPDGRSGQPTTVCSTAAEAVQDVTIAPEPPDPDADKDSIPDALEDALLARYRPYYLFSNDGGEEALRPTDPIWYIRHSALLKDGSEESDPVVPNTTLQANPGAVFVTNADPGSSSFSVQPCRSHYFLNPANEYRSGFHDGDGTDWPGLVSAGGIGLYGHVARDPNEPSLYRIEYWQFYGYNQATTSSVLVGDHEGDWEVVTVLVDSAAPMSHPVGAIHYVHGRPIRFGSVGTAVAPSGSIVELRGSNGSEADHDLDLHEDGDLARAQNAVLKLYCGSEDVCTHPVVYVEWGTHASWPTHRWAYVAVPNHNGLGTYRYLASPPPNLGEDSAPRRTTAGADIILRYNGHWGAFSRSLQPWVDQSPPLGPALHKLWARPQPGAPSADCLE